MAVKRGQDVRTGDAISSGVKNPREMLRLNGINSVQRYLADEISGIYDKRDRTPLHRRNTEVVVRSLTNLSRVRDPGSNPDLLRNDFTTTSSVSAFNSKLRPGQKPVMFEPVLKGTNMMPLEMQQDWMAKMQVKELKDTLLEGVANGSRANLHGTHPIPGIAYGKEFGLGTDKEPWLY